MTTWVILRCCVKCISIYTSVPTLRAQYTRPYVLSHVVSTSFANAIPTPPPQSSDVESGLFQTQAIYHLHLHMSSSEPMPTYIRMKYPWINLGLYKCRRSSTYIHLRAHGWTILVTTKQMGRVVVACSHIYENYKVLITSKTNECTYQLHSFSWTKTRKGKTCR